MGGMKHDILTIDDVSLEVRVSLINRRKRKKLMEDKVEINAELRGRPLADGPA